jgi:hypothetical protein
VKGWVYDKEADSLARLDDTTRSVIRGHELHMLTLAPETRLGEPHGHGARSWAGEAALAVEFRGARPVETACREVRARRWRISLSKLAALVEGTDSAV